MADWSNLDYNVLVDIARRIRVYGDFVRFGVVCSSWREAAVNENFGYASGQIPWLMLPRKTEDKDNYNYTDYYVRCFFSVSTGKTRKSFLPEANGKRYYSSKGWLMTVAYDLSMCLLHPFSRTQIKLPHMKKFKDMYDLSTGPSNMLNFISKCVLSADPSCTSDYILMVIHGDVRKLAYYKPGDKVWTTIEKWECAYLDICYHRGQFYAVDCSGAIMACDFESGDPATATIVAELPDGLIRECYARLYIVGSGESLFVVARLVRRQSCKSRNKTTHQTHRFRVFEVELETNTWAEVNNLGDRTLFLGFNSSFCLQASDSFGCQPNSIYFTDDNFTTYCHSNNRRGGGKDMGIFNIQDCSIDLRFWGNLCNRINPPMWV